MALTDNCDLYAAVNEAPVTQFLKKGVHMRKTFVTFVALACCAFPLLIRSTLVLADEPVVTSVTATFDTTTNDKDHDTLLDVSVFNNRGVLIAQKTGVSGHWNDHSTHQVTLDLKNALKKSQIPAGKMTLVIHPNGNDKWEFNYHIDIAYSDDSSTEKGWDGKVLTQDDGSTSDTWNGN